MEHATHDVNWNAVAVMLGCAAILALFWVQPAKDYIRGRHMKEQRRKEVHQMLADGYTEKIMDLISLGKFTWAEAREEGFNVLKRAYPKCKDLYPSEATLKERIEKTMGTKADEHLQNLSDRTPVVAGKVLFSRRK